MEFWLPLAYIGFSVFADPPSGYCPLFKCITGIGILGI